MEKITNENVLEFYNKRQDFYRHYFTLKERMRKFENNSTLGVFKFIFDEDGDRLLRHFRMDCDNNFDKFLTYLTQEQKNILIVSIVENENMYYL